MEKFKREYNRYLVIKRRDANKYLTVDERIELIRLSSKIADARKDEGKPPLHSVVIENDWPEYEKAWRMIEERVDKEMTRISKKLSEDVNNLSLNSIIGGLYLSLLSWRNMQR